MLQAAPGGAITMPGRLLGLLQRLPALRAWLNRLLINRFTRSTPPRPHRFSLWSPQPPGAPTPSAPSTYTAWPGLVDRHFTGRHLPPTDWPRPPTSEVIRLFERNGPMQESERSSVLFCFFAQWFTDSFLRTMPDLRRTDSNHEIDLCQIYGLDEVTTWALREGAGGRLKTRQVGAQAHPPLLYANGALEPQFAATGYGLSYLRDGRGALWEASLRRRFPPPPPTAEERLATFEAAALERGNSTIFYAVFNTIFVREHNRIAGKLKDAYGWDDDRLVETARLINIRQMLNVVVNDYIRHLGGSFPFSLDRSFAEKERWYRTNRIAVEFNLLYRWHSLVPDEVRLGGRTFSWREYRFNNAPIAEFGIERLISDASRQPAGRMSLYNTPGFLEVAEVASLELARQFDVAPFNAYRARFGLRPYGSIDELTDDARVRDALKRLYGDVDAVEYTVGLLAEGRKGNAVLSETLQHLVAYDAFTHILTNPVLASEVHCEAAFSPLGWEMVHEEATFADIVARNVAGPVHVSFDHRRPDSRRAPATERPAA